MAPELAQPGEAALPLRYSWLYRRSSSRQESHLPALPDLGVAVSRCPAPVTPSAGRAGPRPVVVSEPRQVGCHANAARARSGDRDGDDHLAGGVTLGQVAD